MKTRIGLAAVLLALAAAALPAWSQAARIGYLNVALIERESERPKRDAQKLKQEFAAREQRLREMRGELTAMEQEVEKLKPDASGDEASRKRQALAQRTQQFQQVRRDFVEDLDRRKAEERSRFLRDLTAVVAKVAEAKKLDIVVADAIYASKAIDITGEVMKRLDAASGDASK
jgi:Skp family chaperone for outer membrane proteins